MSRCTFCQMWMYGVRIVVYAKKQIVCCEYCEKLLRSELPSINLAMCCECGLMLEGVFKGLKFLRRDGTPRLELGYSHGMCGPCRKRTWDGWQIIKAERKAKKLATVDIVQQAC